MKWLVTGAAGMLAQDVIAEAEARGHQVIAATRADADLLDAPAIEALVKAERPDVVVNCAAWTGVDAAEDHEAEAFAANATGVQNLARAARDIDAKLVHVSTDYVFDGKQETPYAAEEPLNPLGAYGRTKAAGEWAAQSNCPNTFIVRTAWLFGAGGRWFPKTLARVLKETGSAKVVNDQHGQPTWTADVARIIADLVNTAPPGIYHATSGGVTTWWGFTCEIASSIGVSPEVVEPIGSDAFPSPAPRPTWSALSHDTLVKSGVAPIGRWEERWHEAAKAVLETP